MTFALILKYVVSEAKRLTVYRCLIALLILLCLLFAYLWWCVDSNLIVETKPIRAIQWDNSGKQLALQVGDGALDIATWDSFGNKSIARVRPPGSEEVFGLQWSTDGNQLAFSLKDGTIAILDVRKKAWRSIADPFKESARFSLSWSKDDKMFACKRDQSKGLSTPRSKVLVINASSGEVVADPGTGPHVRALAWNSTNQLALVCMEDIRIVSFSSAERGGDREPQYIGTEIFTLLEDWQMGYISTLHSTFDTINWSPSGKELGLYRNDHTWIFDIKKHTVIFKCLGDWRWNPKGDELGMAWINLIGEGDAIPQLKLIPFPPLNKSEPGLEAQMRPAENPRFGSATDIIWSDSSVVTLFERRGFEYIVSRWGRENVFNNNNTSLDVKLMETFRWKVEAYKWEVGYWFMSGRFYLRSYIPEVSINPDGMSIAIDYFIVQNEERYYVVRKVSLR